VPSKLLFGVFFPVDGRGCEGIQTLQNFPDTKKENSLKKSLCKFKSKKIKICKLFKEKYCKLYGKKYTELFKKKFKEFRFKDKTLYIVMTDTQKKIFYPTTGHTCSDGIKLRMLQQSLRKLQRTYNIFIANEELKQLELKYKFIIQEEDENDEIIQVFHSFTKEEIEKMEREYNEKANKIYKKLNRFNAKKDLIKAEISKITKFHPQEYDTTPPTSDDETDWNEDEDN
jgi:hypothetical protein